MRKLQFIANCENHSHGADSCHVTQTYVMNLLAVQLAQYGFKTESTDLTQNLSLSVAHHYVKLSVNCQLKNEDGTLLCEISTDADEAQPWFKKIETQSIMKQLAHAIENSLQQEQNFTALQWRI